MMSKRISLTVFVLVFSFLTFYACPSSWAIVMGAEVQAVTFRFNNPGARSNAMGGAFIGLADDATAAFTNPAGLTILTKPEISVEYKYVEVTNLFFDWVGVHEDDETLSDLSFLSYVHPMEKTSVAVFRHQFFHLKANDAVEIGGTQTVNLEMDAVTYGIGVGHEVTDTFSLGISIGFDQLDWNLNNISYWPGFAPDPDADRIQSVDDTSWAEHFIASVLWNPFGELNIGLVYRMGPEFETKYVTSEWLDVGGKVYYPPISTVEETFKVPDVWGIGISYRFFSNFTTNLDVNYVEYSDFVDEVLVWSGEDISDDFTIDDEVEIRIGFEYIFDINEIPFAVRAGYYYVPNQKWVYSGTDPTIISVIEQAPDTEDHIFSLGFGAAFNNFQIDVAGSAGDYIKEFTSSIVFRFD